MDDRFEYKFKPLTIIILDVLIIYMIYCVIDGLISHAQIDAFSLFMLSGVAIVFVPMVNIIRLTIRMLKGLPAMIITKDGIIDNVNNVSIDWHDILEIYVTEEGRFAGGNLVVNVQTPEAFFFKTPLQKVFYKVRKYFTLADFAIKLSFIKGKSKDIVNTIDTYWAQS